MQISFVMLLLKINRENNPLLTSDPHFNKIQKTFSKHAGIIGSRHTKAFASFVYISFCPLLPLVKLSSFYKTYLGCYLFCLSRYISHLFLIE